MPFRNMSTDDVRNIVRHQIETLERWLRKLLDDTVHAHYGGLLTNPPIKKEFIEDAVARRNREPVRYPREVDALLFDDLAKIICNNDLYKKHFRVALEEAFPSGAQEAKFFFMRVYEARNPVSHANEINQHQAMRVFCYANDVIESLKNYYVRINMEQTYNAPSFIRVWDNLGNNQQIGGTNSVNIEFRDKPLRPGDVLHLEVQPDESFADDSYEIDWTVCNVDSGETGTSRRFSLDIGDKHVTQDGLPIQARIVSRKSWHRHGQYDALLVVRYPVLPPI